MERIDPLLKKAQKYLQSAAVLLELEDYDSCVSRAYFAMFYTAQAMLLSEGYSLPGNQGIRSTFSEVFVQSGRLPRRAETAFNHAAELQELGDYAQNFVIPREEAEKALQEAEAFVQSLTRIVTQQA